MSKYSEKVIKGETTSSREWLEHLKEAHSKSPGMSPKVFNNYRTSDGFTSYELLAKEASYLKGQKPKLLDLACGNGHLLPMLQKEAPDAELVALDMSESELALLRENLPVPGVHIICASADNTGIETASLDGIFCHMAFMLMEPIDPVVMEINRCLKPGGIFAAVIGSLQGSCPSLNFLTDLISSFISKNFPDFKMGVTGDPRLHNEEGIGEVLSSLSDINVKEFDFNVSLDIGKIWDFFKDFYIITLLPESQIQPLRNFFEEQAQKKFGKRIDFKYSQRLIIAKKPI